MFGFVCVGGCSRGALVPDAVPEACNFPLPKRCDVCSTGETVCAHYVVRDGVCTAETCPPAPSFPDAGPSRPDAAPSLPDAAPALPDPFTPGMDARMDSPGVTPVGPTFDCGPADAGLRCSCGLENYFPAPIIDGGQQTFVLPPDPATVVAYGTMAEFDALAVGRWQRTAGMGELICEQFGLEFTADHRLVPLVIASDGSVQGVTAQARSFGISFDGARPTGLGAGSLSTNAPIFFDGGRSMYFLFSPWPANYVRAP